MPSAGNLLGITRAPHPEEFASACSSDLSACISGGVICSFPGQNGHVAVLLFSRVSVIKLLGRLPRVVAIITQRPVMGSFLRSGMVFLLLY